MPLYKSVQRVVRYRQATMYNGSNIRLVFSGSNIQRTKCSFHKKMFFVEFVFSYWLFPPSSSPLHLVTTKQVYPIHKCCLCDVGQATCMSGLILLMYQVSSQVQWLPFMFWPSQVVVSVKQMGWSITV